MLLLRKKAALTNSDTCQAPIQVDSLVHRYPELPSARGCLVPLETCFLKDLRQSFSAVQSLPTDRESCSLDVLVSFKTAYRKDTQTQSSVAPLEPIHEESDFRSSYTQWLTIELVRSWIHCGTHVQKKSAHLKPRRAYLTYPPSLLAKH